METKDGYGHQHEGDGFLNFLRGMETLAERLAAAVLCDFLNFLRGMETAAPEPCNAPKCAFLNFLRGMETGDSLSTDCTCRILPKLP